MKTDLKDNLSFSCPLPIQDYPQVLLAHGSGGKLMQKLIDTMFIKTFSDQTIHDCHDAAVRDFGAGRLAMTTDSYVVSPLIFPGGDIGRLAVNGTINDLAMAGAKPLYLSVSLILEEGLSMQTLWQITRSIKDAADQAGVQIITGDTKVVDKGRGTGFSSRRPGLVQSPPALISTRNRSHPVAILSSAGTWPVMGWRSWPSAKAWNSIVPLKVIPLR